MLRYMIPALLVVFALDQFSKWAVVWKLNLITLGRIDIWPGVLHFVMGWNRGINFGLFAGDSDLLRWALVAVALGICLWVLHWMRDEVRLAPLVSAGALIGGAMGNVLDRIRFGAVVDFLNVSCCGLHNPTSFNVADIGIFCGAMGLIFFSSNQNKT